MKDSEREHMRNSKLYVGCLPCLLSGWENVHSDYHHTTEGYRVGHMHGYPACLWHHRGVLDCQWKVDEDELRSRIGPSLALQGREYRDHFGTQGQLVELNNYALELWRVTPWLEHDMPLKVANKIRVKHREARA